MPGFIIHLAEATIIMEHMEKKTDAVWRQEFMLGNLLPDTRLGKDKVSSHFWSSEHEDYIARAPKLEYFLTKYGHRLDEPAILGYYAHLYLDEHYVDEYWPQIMKFEDAEGHLEPRRAYIYQVEMRQDGKIIPFGEFFTTENYYGDYTRSNQWFVEKYHIQPPEYKYLENIHMDEVHAEDLKYVLEELNHICHKGKMGDEKEMSVFNLRELDDFVQRTAESFYTHVKHIVHMEYKGI